MELFYYAEGGKSLERARRVNRRAVWHAQCALTVVGGGSHRLRCCHPPENSDALICESAMMPVLSPIGILHSTKNRARNTFCLENTLNKVKAPWLEIIPLVGGTDFNISDQKVVNTLIIDIVTP